MERIRTLFNDLRLAARALLRQKAWTAVTIATLALGIGANSALFTIVNAVLLRPLPYFQPDRIVAPSVETKSNDLEVVPSDVYRAWAAESKSLSSIAAYFPGQMIDVQGDAPTLITGYEVTASYFDVLGVAPEVGRVFTAGEDVPNGPPMIVLSDQLWRTRFAGDRTVIGKAVTIGEKEWIVVGVMPARFSRTRRAMYWTPARLETSDPAGVTFFYFTLGRLGAGWTTESSRAELAAITTRAASRKPTERGPAASPPTVYAPVVMTLHERLFGSARPALLMLFAAVSVLLLIACANVSNLLLARAMRRGREFAIRSALGASRGRVLQYLLCESLLLSAIGGALGLLVPTVAIGSLMKLSPPTVASVERVRVDGNVFGVTAAVVVITAIFFAVIPGFNSARRDPASALASGGSRSTGSAGQHRLRGLIVVGQLATALVLLTGAGLLGRSFVLATTVDPGFRTENLFALRLSLPRARYPDERASQFFKTLLDRSRGVHGVRSAALTDLTPLSGVPASSSTRDADGHVLRYDDAGVGPGYFETVGLAVKQGRAFDAADPASAREVVISEAMARMAFPGRNPIGQRLGVGVNAPNVVGVVADVRQRGLERQSLPLVYRPILDTGMTSLGTRGTLLVRAEGDPAQISVAIRAIIHQMDARVLLPEMRSINDIIAEAAVPRRFNSLVLGSFAVLAAVLAVIGLYGVLAYVVSDRTHEIGVRVALGADRTRVLSLVIGQGAALIAIGVGLGLLASIAAVRSLRALVFGVDVYDPTTFVAAAGLLTGAALLACYIPASRAAHVDPIIALRAD
jgi:putative ABC transport system permease protein